MTETTKGWLQRYSASRILYFVAVAAAGVAAYLYGGDLIHENKEATEVIVLVFPILAGFLIAIMTIVGDPTAFGSGSWRSVEMARDATFNSLARQKWLFLLYLITVLGAFAAALLKKTCPYATEIIERVYFGAAVSAFLMSLSLPGALMKIQLERHDLMIARKRAEAAEAAEAATVEPEADPAAPSVNKPGKQKR
jgi:hypothetical protein